MLLSSTNYSLGTSVPQSAERRVPFERLGVPSQDFGFWLNYRWREEAFYGFRSKRIESVIAAFHDAAPSKNSSRESHATRGLSIARNGRRHRAFRPEI